VISQNLISAIDFPDAGIPPFTDALEAFPHPAAALQIRAN